MISRDKHSSPAAALAAGAFFLFWVTTVSGAPGISVTTSFSDGRLTVALTGKDLPELKRLVVDCSYDPLRLSILEAGVAAPLPATALSAAVDQALSKAVFTVLAASTILIDDGSTVLRLRIPAQEECLSAFVVTRATAIDKNDAEFTVSVDQASTTAHMFPARTTLLSSRTAIGLQLNGRLLATRHGREVPGFYLYTTPRMRPGSVVLERR